MPKTGNGEPLRDLSSQVALNSPQDVVGAGLETVSPEQGQQLLAALIAEPG